jgi:hypothetical protein
MRGGQVDPMSYEAGGKQYVVTVDGGHGSFGTKLGDYVRAYALPAKAGSWPFEAVAIGRCGSCAAGNSIRAGSDACPAAAARRHGAG